MSDGRTVSYADRNLLARADFIVNTTEDILLEMEEKGVSKSDLAKKLGKSRSFVTQVLSGSRNLTLSTLSDISMALGVSCRVEFADKAARYSKLIVGAMVEPAIRKTVVGGEQAANSVWSRVNTAPQKLLKLAANG